MWADYKAFLTRGNLVELATAFILGVAFAAVVTTFTEGVLMQLISAIAGEPDFDDVVLDLAGTPILIGTFLTAVVNFLLVASVLFLIVRAIGRMRRPGPEDGITPDSDEVVLLREIRDALRTSR